MRKIKILTDSTADLSKELNNIYDLERIVGRISYGNLSPRDLLQLKKSLGSLPNIKKLLVEGNTNSFLKLENTEGNMIYSPLSIKYALEMLK